jgi:formylglycine-generating enzyme required for sulfatase activity
MKKTLLLSTAVCLFISGVSFADIFAAGTANEFTIDFVTISGDSGDLGNWPAGSGFTFSGVNHGDYRIGVYEITNDQWTKFENEYGVVWGNPKYAYDMDSTSTGTNIPTNYVSWYEAAQFVNWLNVSTNHQAAYKFTGTQGTSNYTFDVWDASEAWGGTNLYRHKDAYYFLPTQEEWVKAAYWNGTSLQTYATKAGESLYLGNGSNGGWAYYDTSWDTVIDGGWDVGSGSEELNGTYDMMGNMSEWMESHNRYSDYLPDSPHPFRGGAWDLNEGYLRSSYHYSFDPYVEYHDIGFRVASVPEPTSLALLFLGGLALRHRKR